MRYRCKGRHFSLLHHFRHRTKHRSRHFNHANYTNPFPAISTSSIPNISTSGFSKLMQNTHIHLLLLYTLLSIDIGQHMSKHIFSQCNLVSRLYALRSIRNLHHWKGLLLARQFEYKLYMVWIRGSESEVIGCQSPKILTPDLAELRDPLGSP